MLPMGRSRLKKPMREEARRRKDKKRSP